MTLKLTPPKLDSSLWQAVCRDHGLLMHARPRAMVVLQSRIHDYHHDEECPIVAGGLRCMFCQVVLDVRAWAPNVAIACDLCLELVSYGLMRDDVPAWSLSHYAG